MQYAKRLGHLILLNLLFSKKLFSCGEYMVLGENVAALQMEQGLLGSPFHLQASWFPRGATLGLASQGPEGGMCLVWVFTGLKASETSSFNHRIECYTFHIWERIKGKYTHTAHTSPKTAQVPLRLLDFVIWIPLHSGATVWPQDTPESADILVIYTKCCCDPRSY